MNNKLSLVILDRDGVINYDSTEYIKSPDEWHPIPGSLAAIAQLNRAGFQVVVATNQSGVARGLYDLTILNEIHKKLLRELRAVGGHIDEIFFCPHHPDEGCHCRKPKPGLLARIKEKYAINMADTFFVGDSQVDMEAAHLAGCKPILVLTGKGASTLQQYPELLDIPHYPDLAHAVNYIISTKSKINE